MEHPSDETEAADGMGAAQALALPPRLTPPAAAPLAAALLARRGRALALDASEVAVLSTPCVQALLAAARSWREDGLRLEIVAPTPEFVATLADLGLGPESIGTATLGPGSPGPETLGPGEA